MRNHGNARNRSVANEIWPEMDFGIREEPRGVYIYTKGTQLLNSGFRTRAGTAYSSGFLAFLGPRRRVLGLRLPGRDL